MHTRTKIILTLCLLIIALIVSGYFLLSGAIPGVNFSRVGKESVISENLTIPDTREVNPATGSMLTPGTTATKLVPNTEDERVTVPSAVLTVKGVVELATSPALLWAEDARLVFIKSLGAVTLEGKSSQWQAVFHSETLAKGYELIVRGNSIISRKEIASTTQGGTLPESWKDSDHPIKTIQSLPQFSEATVSAISFAYNASSGLWRYGLATSRGPTSTGAN